MYTRENAPTIIVHVRIYKEYDVEDNFDQFFISMWYIKPIIPFYYEELLYFVILSLLANLLFNFNI